MTRKQEHANHNMDHSKLLIETILESDRFGFSRETGLRCAAFSADGKWVAVGGDDNEPVIRLWDLELSKEVQCFKGHEYGIWCAVFLEKRKQLLTSSGPFGILAVRLSLSKKRTGTIKLWDAITGQCIRTFTNADKLCVDGLAALGDGQHFLCACNHDMDIKQWETDTGRLVKTFEGLAYGGHTNSVMCVAVTKDGTQAVSGAMDNLVKQWDVATGKCLRSFGGHTDGVRRVALTSRGDIAVSGSGDHTVRLWDTKNDQLLWTLEGHMGTLWWVAVTSNGHRVISGGADRTMKLWDTKSGALLASIDFEDGVIGLAFPSDERYAYGASQDGTVKRLDLSTITGAVAETIQVTSAPIHILHLSDIHLGTSSQAEQYRTPLS